jgi:cold shock CspA family protein
MPGPLLVGVIETFDEAAGLGTVKAVDGARYPFHCTQLADGTRTVPAGAGVVFEVVAGHRGRWEAGAIQRC